MPFECFVNGKRVSLPVNRIRMKKRGCYGMVCLFITSHWVA